MRLTRFTDNALRCLLYLARTPDRTATVGEVAGRMGMSSDQLLKVIQKLVALGYVRTVRGRNGGLKLARKAEAITVAEVVRATEPSFALAACFEPGNVECPLTGACELASVLDQSLRAFFSVLERRTIAEVAVAPHLSSAAGAAGA